jgi:predicted nucleotidyltransferase
MKKYLDIAKISERVSAVAEKYGIVYAVLFGSIIEGRFIADESDVDLAIKVDRLDKSELFSFLNGFLRDLDFDNLDVVVVNFSPFSLNYEILTRGKIVFCRNEEELFEDRLKVIKLYDDWISLSKVFEEKEMEKVIR